METKTFLQKALSREGYYCVFAARMSDERKAQKFYDTIDAVVDAANNFDLEGYDVYYGLATFHEAGSRKVNNVRHLNSFFLDLDCGPSKEFLSQAQAVDELRLFCKKHNLPKPTMVSSGRGVHVYWFLSESVSYETWYPVAERLKRLCAEDGFAADPAVTSDAARVLRVPHTHNHKTDPPSEVKFFGSSTPKFETVDFDAFSELLGTDVIPVPTKYTPVAMSAAMQNLMGNQENVFKDILLKTAMGKGCEQLSYVLQNQETMSEPMWRAGLSIAKFCIDGDKAAHKLSHKHPEYTAQSTEKKLSLIKGPYTCARFDEFRPDVCPECPHWGEIKSPIVLGRKLREAEVDEDGNYEVEPDAPEEPAYVIPRYPPPYLRGANGGVYLRTRDQDGDIEEKVIYPYDLYVTKRIRNPELGEMVMMRLHLPHDAVREFTIPMSSVTSREELRKSLSSQGVAVQRMDEIMNYTLKWVEELQATSVAEEAHLQFGWTDDTHEAFVLGGQTVRKDSIENNPPATQTNGYFEFFKPKGTLEGWKEAIKFWEDERFVLQQFGLGMGFGSPLMEFLNEPCGSVAFINHESGVGKTMMLLAAAGIWGDPDKLVLKATDTAAFKLNRAEVMHSLPVGIDEVTNMTPKQMSELIYQGTQGTQPGRMTAQANVARYQGRPWSLLMGYTANTSVVETVSRGKAMPKAEAQRVLECRVNRLLDQHGEKDLQDEFKKRILNNYGHAGTIFIQWVMRNLEETVALLQKVRRRVDKAAELTSENRFWSDAITATISGLLIAKQIGLHEYDVAKVFEWATTDLIKQNKDGLNEMAMSVPDLLNDFFNENINGILQIKSTEDCRNGNGLDELVIPEQVARGELIARYETDRKWFYIRPKPLKMWCGELQVNYADLVRQIIDVYGGKRTKIHIWKGTAMGSMGTAAVIAVKFDPESDDGRTEDT